VSPEQRLLVACAQAAFAGRPADVSALLSPLLDGEALNRESFRHGLDAAVSEQLAHQDGAAVLEDATVPEEAFENLKARSASLLTYNLHRLRVLLRLVDALGAAGVSVLPFKGPLLAHQYYGNLAFRNFGDLDLLVPRSALAQTRRVLLAQGFVPPAARTADEEAEMVEAQLGVEFVRPADGVQVEVHWALLNETFAFPLPFDAVWARAHQYRVGATAVHALAPEDLLLYLCAHGTKHHWAALKWVSDVAHVYRNADLNVDVLRARARDLDSDRMLGVGLRLAHRWYGVELPPALRRIAEGRVVRRLTAHVESRWLFGDAGTDRTPRWEQLRFFLRIRRRWASRWPLVRQYARLMATPTVNDRTFWGRWPGWVPGGYYALRPVRLAVEAARGRTAAQHRPGLSRSGDA
jgi:hypothetical protein